MTCQKQENVTSLYQKHVQRYMHSDMSTTTDKNVNEGAMDKHISTQIDESRAFHQGTEPSKRWTI